MKNLIITLAIVIIISNLLAFQYDSYNLVWTMNNMKNLCDEMTRSGALCIKEKELAGGDIAFDKEKGKEKAQAVFNSQLKKIQGRTKHFIFDANSITYTISFNNSTDRVKTTIKCGKPKLTLKYLTTDKSLKCTSTYEYKL